MGYGCKTKFVYKVALPIDDDEIQAHEIFCDYLSKLITDAKTKMEIRAKEFADRKPRASRVTARRRNKKSEPVDELPMALTD